MLQIIWEPILQLQGFCLALLLLSLMPTNVQHYFNLVIIIMTATFYQCLS